MSAKPPFTNQHKRNYIMLQDIAKQHTIIPEDIPFDPKAVFSKDERVFCINEVYAPELCRDVDRFTRKSAETILGSKTYIIDTTNRLLAEWCGTSRQIVVGAILHDDKEIVLLQLEAKTIIDRYKPGVLTMVQGHTSASYLYHGPLRIDGLSFVDMLSDNMGRELCEELRLDDASEEEQTKFRQLCKYLPLAIDTNIGSVSYDNEGTIRRHVCFFFDIDVRCNDTFYRYFREHRIVSNEPSKHTVRYLSYQDLLDLPSMDEVCDWVKGALVKCDWFDNFCDDKTLQNYEMD